MRTILIFIFLSYAAIANAQKHSFHPKYSVVLDTLKGKELLKQCSRAVPDNISGFWIVKPNEIQTLEDKFKLISKLYKDLRKPEGFANYGYQYIGIIINGEKFIYINAFLLDIGIGNYKSTYKTEPVVICDGGNGFWGVLYNIKKQEFSQLSINGEG